MKLMFASDIHGSRAWCEKVRERFEAEAPERLILLGDLLYHGPRNNLPLEYDPKGVIAILNSMKEHLLCVRGNCDAEVDQMVLEFPIMADYMILYLEGRMVFVTLCWVRGIFYSTAILMYRLWTRWEIISTSIPVPARCLKKATATAT